MDCKHTTIVFNPRPCILRVCTLRLHHRLPSHSCGFLACAQPVLPTVPPGPTGVPRDSAEPPPPTLALSCLLSAFSATPAPESLLLRHSYLLFSLVQTLLFFQTCCPLPSFDSESGLSGRVRADSADSAPRIIAPRFPLRPLNPNPDGSRGASRPPKNISGLGPRRRLLFVFLPAA